METKRETKELTTSGGTIVVYKTYATGREFNEIQGVYLASAKINMVGKDVSVEGFDPTAEVKANAKMIEMLVVSVNGKTEDVLNACLDLPSNEYQEVVKVVSEISGTKKKSE